LGLGEAEEGDLVFADVGVDVQGGLCAVGGESREGGDADTYVVADTGAFEDGLVGAYTFLATTICFGPPPLVGMSGYSVRRACMGWTVAALRAGITAASSTMTTMRAVVAARVTGSNTVTL